MSSQMVNMRYPSIILDKVDRFKEKKGFNTRTQAILYLLQYALEHLDKDDKKND